MKTNPNELSLGIETLEALDAPANGEGARAFFLGLAAGILVVAIVVT